MASEAQEKKLNDLCFNLSQCYRGDNYRLLRFCLHGIVPGGILNTQQVGQYLFNELHTSGSISFSNIKILSDIANLTGIVAAKNHIEKYKKNKYVQQDLKGETFSAKRRDLFKMLKYVGKPELQIVIAKYKSTLVNTFDNIWDVVFELDQNLLLETDKDMKTFLDCLLPKTQKLYKGGPTKYSHKRKRKTTESDEEDDEPSSPEKAPRKRKGKTRTAEPDQSSRKIKRKVEESHEEDEPSSSGKVPQKKKRETREKRDKGIDKPKSKTEDQPTKPEKNYIMISYNHKHKIIVNRIFKRLKELKFNVWRDVDKISGDAYDCMDEAVKNATIVLICISEDYEKSNFCKYESEKIEEYGKPFIPLIMEEYQKEGKSWVKQMISGKIYVNFDSETSGHGYTDSMKKLVKQIEEIQKKENLPDLKE